MAWVALALFVGGVLSATFAIYVESGTEERERGRLPLLLWALAVALFIPAIAISPFIVSR